MWANRTNQSNDFADGNSSEQCSCLWLGAGGSGKTYAYAKVIRPLFKRFLGQQGFVVGAPTHAAVRLLGLEARTLHKLANASPQTRVDRKSLRNAPRKADALELLLQKAFACVLDEISMSPPEVYHAASYKCSLLRQERLELDMDKYLTQWFGKMNVSIQLGDFLQLRPVARRSLCEWIEARSASAATDDDVDDQDEDDEAGIHVLFSKVCNEFGVGVSKVFFFPTLQVAESNAAELGRFLFKNCIQHVVHFTGTGRFSACASGAALVDILCSMREGRILPEELWSQLQGRVVDLNALSSDAGTINKILAAHWGALAWEQIARLQHLRVQLEAKRAKRTVFYSQAIDLPAGPGTFSEEDAKSALKVVNMTKTNYLMGMCPLFIGMEVRLSCVVQEPLLTREVPGIIRRIALHPKEVIPPDIGASTVHILKYQPLGVLVEVDDPEYAKYTSGDDGHAVQTFLDRAHCTEATMAVHDCAEARHFFEETPASIGSAERSGPFWFARCYSTKRNFDRTHKTSKHH